MIQATWQALVGNHFGARRIEPGSVYHRVQATIKETAHVLSVEPDGAGITHVHYIGQFEARHGHGAEYQVPRRLSLAAFRKSFCELT